MFIFRPDTDYSSSGIKPNGKRKQQTPAVIGRGSIIRVHESQQHLKEIG